MTGQSDAERAALVQRRPAGRGAAPVLGPHPSVCQLRPGNRGTVLIRSPDPGAHPAIVANDLTTETDRRCIVDGRHLASPTEPLQSFIAEEIEPGPEKVSDDDMLAHARARGSTIFHPSGTCMMAPGASARWRRPSPTRTSA